MSLSALSRAFGQLGDPRIRRVLLLSVGLTFVGYLVLVVGLAVGLGSLDATATPWLETLLDWATGLAVFVLALWLFPAIVTLMAGLFTDGVAEAVDARHYPHLMPPRRVPLGETLAGAGRFTLLALGLNLIALPIYLLVPLANLVVFYALNGTLLGREFYDQAAARRLTPVEARAVRRRHRLRLWGLGAMLAFLGSLPGINLLVPVIGTAAMVHLLQRLHPAEGAAAP